jgi:hypothetical protein
VVAKAVLFLVQLNVNGAVPLMTFDVRLTDVPRQMAPDGAPPIDMDGLGLTTRVALAEAVQPLLSVTVTMKGNVPALAALGEMEDVVAPPGLQLKL